MKHRNSIIISGQDMQELKRARPLLTKKLEQVTLQLSSGSFDDGYGINLALVEQQIVEQRLQDIEKLLRSSRVSTGKPQLKG